MKKRYMVFKVWPKRGLLENVMSVADVVDDRGNWQIAPNPFDSREEAELFIQHYCMKGYHYTIIETYLKE